ncbi:MULTISPECIES: precorrin-3B synthase [unclassified Nostoc]|uniref:precorrin-3B synthase n=1 Tax=unclassified Nostoc TaxID=2593658 RepID=UPI001F554E2E|nr:MULTISPECIES: precorrin-3B synthase [unclassified Nostoc]
MLSASTPCPGLFYATPAKDGILSRIRIPGGILNSKQCGAIAVIADMYGGYVDVTNRANLQIREISQGINAEVLKQLQDLGLGSRNPMIDHIRNIMSSPTAGIDSQEIIDTRPLVQGWDDYLAAHSELAGLSAKFSVCFDGGGLVSVSDRLNDILFAAILIDHNVYFRLHLSIGEKGKPPSDVGIIVTPDECLLVLAALADVYLAHIDTSSKRKPRLREVINSLGCDHYLQKVEKRLPFSWKRFKQSLVKKDQRSSYIGIHPQRQPGLFYIGVVLPLGRLESQQIRSLGDLAAKFGSGTIRLTPWQNLLITDIPQQYVADVQSEIIGLGLDFAVTNIKSALVACSGKRGCAASATDTKAHALALSDYLQTRVKLNCPINIHFTGCEKSCAQHHSSDITLLGVKNGNIESYHIYVGDGDNHEKFGRLLYQNVSFKELPSLIEKMLNVYKSYRIHADESFKEFSYRYGITPLKELFSQHTYNLHTSAVCN